MGGGRRGQPDHTNIIQAAVGALVTPRMVWVADITKATVEAWTSAEDSGNGILSFMREHLCHIFDVPTNEEVLPIWVEVAASKN